MKDDLWKILTAAVLLGLVWIAYKLGLLDLIGEWLMDQLRPQEE